jgi:tetratricopeptide (TPR) repeat protein
MISFLLGFPLPAAAEDLTIGRAAARALGAEGVAAYKRGAYTEALEQLDRAYQVVSAPSLALWSARTLVKLGRWVEASDRYLQATRLETSTGNVAIQTKAKQDAQQELAELRSRLPHLEVAITGVPAQDVSLTLDGTSLPAALVGTRIPIDPGRHHFEGRFDEQVQTLEIVAVERQVAPVRLQFRPATATVVPTPEAAVPSPAPIADSGPAPAKPSSSSVRAIGWVAIGVGSAAVAVGALTGLMAVNQHANLEQYCKAGSCYRDKAGEVEDYNSLRSTSTVAFVAGGVIGATGLVLVLTAPTRDPSLSLVVAPRGVALRGEL